MSEPNNNALAFLADVAKRREDEIAINDGLRSLSYTELLEQVACMATVYRDLGIQSGDKIVLFSSDNADAAIALLASLYVGAIGVPVTELSSEVDLRKILTDCEPTGIVVSEACLPVFDSVRDDIQSIKFSLVIGKPGDEDVAFHQRIDEAAPSDIAISKLDDIALILYSAAKKDGSDESVVTGVAHRHDVPLRSFESFAAAFLNLTQDDRVLSTIRFSSAYGLGTGLFFPLMAGAQVVLISEQPTTKRIIEQIEWTKPSVFLATPSVYGQLGRDCEALDIETPLAALRSCVSGAEDMPPRVIDMARDRLGAEVTVGYGLTESFQFVIAGNSASGRRGACGRPMDGFEVRILNDEKEPVDKNEIGTLQIRGPAVASSYTNGDSILDTEGWFTTQDRFMVDAEGRYYHCGRIDDQFKVSGKWVLPSEVERVLFGHEAVWECAVIGADDEDGLMNPLAFIVTNIGHKASKKLEEELRQYVKKELAPYKYPRWIEFIDEMPKGPHGKILRYKLREKIRGNANRRRAVTLTPPTNK